MPHCLDVQSCLPVGKPSKEGGVVFYTEEEDVILNVILFNYSPEETKSGRLRVKETAIFHLSSMYIPKIEPLSTCTVQFTCRVKEEATLQDIPVGLEFEFNGEPLSYYFDREEPKTNKIPMPMRAFTRGVYELKPVPCEKLGNPLLFNILFFGLAGSGKSSFGNSVHSMLSGMIESPIPAGGGSNHVTTRISHSTYGHFRVYDTWGLSEKEYLNGELEKILDGAVMPGTDMRDAIAPQNSQRNPQHQIHSVLFFLPANLLQDESMRPVLEHSKKYVDLIAGKGYNPIIVISRLDEILDDLRTSIYNDTLTENSRVRDMVDRASQSLGVTSNRIFISLNYNSNSKILERRNIPGMDKNTLRILTAALQVASDFVQTKARGVRAIHRPAKNPAHPALPLGNAKQSTNITTNPQANQKRTTKLVPSNQNLFN